MASLPVSLQLPVAENTKALTPSAPDGAGIGGWCMGEAGNSRRVPVSYQNVYSGGS